MENINKDKYNTEENRRKVEEKLSKILGQELKCLSIKVRDKDEVKAEDASKKDVYISDEKKKQIDETLSEIFGQETKGVSAKWKEDPNMVVEDLFSTIVTNENGEKTLVNIGMFTSH